MARYREIADDMRSKIRSKEWPVGFQLPGISALQQTYDVPGLNTIRAAQQLLVEEGMLETRQGVGAFVISTESLREVDVTAELTRARDALTKALAAMAAPRRSVTFDLDADELLDFVLTQSLRDFAERQRWEAENDPAIAENRLEWAASAEAALEQVEGPS